MALFWMSSCVRQADSTQMGLKTAVICMISNQK